MGLDKKQSKIFLTFLICIVLVPVEALFSQSADYLFSQGEQFWEKREWSYSGRNWQESNSFKAIDNFERALLQGNRSEYAVRYMEAIVYAVNHVCEGKNEKRFLLARGASVLKWLDRSRHGEDEDWIFIDVDDDEFISRIKKLDCEVTPPLIVEGTICHMQWMGVAPVLKVYDAIKTDITIKPWLEDAWEHGRDYKDGVAYSLLGRFYLFAPSMVGGIGIDGGIEYLETAYSRYPTAFNAIELAKGLMERGDNGDYEQAVNYAEVSLQKARREMSGDDYRHFAEGANGLIADLRRKLR